jgi:protein involved in polysaccharide export with SLBB domain
MKAMNLFKSLKACVWMPGVLLLLAGCGGMEYASDPVNPAQPFAFPGQSATADAGQSQAPSVAPSTALPQAPVPIPPVAVNPNAMLNSRLASGELVKVTFSDIPNPPPPVEIRIPEDGRITLPYNMTVYAIGKTVSQLQEEIRSMYVPKLFVLLTVNIKTEDRVYYVGGEVRQPARQPYIGDITVLRAIDSVGGFTDFANRKKIELRRANGEVHIIRWDKARTNPKLDLKVYPNDQITVHRRW